MLLPNLQNKLHYHKVVSNATAAQPDNLVVWKQTKIFSLILGTTDSLQLLASIPEKSLHVILIYFDIRK